MQPLRDVLTLPLHLLPGAVVNELAAAAANHLLRGQTLGLRLAELSGKTVCIELTDVGRAIYLQVKDGRLRAAAAGPARVSIRGSLDAFWSLAMREQDPDTLFFRRQLCVEGETETGLHIKNLLDAFEYDWEAHFQAVLGERLAALLAAPLRALVRRLG